jgi:outer membrane protein insertion porin family
MDRVEPPRHRSWLRRLLLGSLLAALAVGALVAMGWFPQEPLRRLVESQLRETIGPESHIGRLHVVPRRLWIEIDELTVDGRGYRLEVPHVRAGLSWALVLGRALSVKYLELQSPRILIRPAPQTAEGEPFTQRVLVGNLQITDGTVIYRDPKLEGDVTVEDVDVRGSVGAGILEIATPGGSWARPQPIPIGPASARVSISPDLQVKIERLEGGTESSRLRVSGPLGSINELKPDLQLAAALDLSDARYLPAAPPMEGRLDATGSISGRLDALVAQLRIAGSQLRIQDWRVDRVEAHLDHTASTPARSAGRVSVEMLGGHAQGEARLSGATVQARLDLVGLQTSAVPSSVLGGDPVLRGSVSGKMKAEGELDRTLDVQGELQVNGRDTSGLQHAIVASASGSARPSDRRIDLSWQTTVESNPAHASSGLPRLKVAHLFAEGTAQGLPVSVSGGLRGRVLIEAEAGPLEAGAQGSLQWQEGGAAKASLEGTGLGGFLRAAVETQGNLVRSLSLEGGSLDIAALVPQAGGRLAFDLKASGPADRLSGAGQAKVEDLSWRAVDVGTVSLGLQADEGRGNLTLDVPSFNVSGQGAVSAGARPELRGTVRLDRTPLAPLAPLLPQGRSLEGQISATLNLDVPLKALPTASVEAVIESAEVTSGELSARTVKPFTVEGRSRRVIIQGFEAEGMGASLRASGSVGLDPGAAVEATAQLGADLAKLPVPQQWHLSGRAETEARLSGSAKQPRISGQTTLRDVILVAEGSQVPLLALAEGRVDLAGNRVAISGLDATLAGGSLRLTADVPLAAAMPDARLQADRVSADETAHIQAAWNGIEAGPLTEALQLRRAQPVTTTLAGEAHISGGLAALQEITGALRIPLTSVRIEEREFQVEPLSMDLEKGQVTTNGLTINSPAGTFRAEGRVDLVRREVDASGKGQFELRALSPFLEDAALTGTANVDVAVSGTPDAPRARGTIAVADATLRLAQIPQAVTDLKARIVLDETALRFEEASAVFGGGTVTLSGSAQVAGATLTDVRLDLAGRDIALRYPLDFRSRLRADLSLTGRPEALLLTGDVVMERGLYDKDIHLEEQFLGPSVPPAEPQASPLLQAIALDIQASTENPVLVRNNLAELEATGSLRVRGDAAVPAPLGRLEIRDGGKVHLQGREFTIQSGTLIYNGSIDPEISLRAQTLIPQVGADPVQVNIAADGPLLSPKVDLTSDPSYSQRELVSLIATGRRNADADSSAWVAGEQAATLFTSRLSRRVSRAFKGLGFDEVEIQPELIAREADPGARFTFGKQLTSRMKVVYSTALNNPEARFFQTLYRFPLALEAKLQRDDEGSFTYGAGQKFRWGAPVKRRRPAHVDERRELTDVRVEGDRSLPEGTLRGAVRARAGKKVSYWNLQDDAERMQRRLVKAGYIEALVTSRFDGDVAAFEVHSGDLYRWRVEGLSGPPDLTRQIRGALYEEDALDRGRARLLSEARGRGHLRARVETRVLRAAGEKTLVFAVDLGPVVTASEVGFPGAEALSQRRLLGEAGGAAAFLAAPKEAEEQIREAYRREHYLAAEVGPTQVFESEGGSQIRIVVPVREGAQARFASVRFEGATRPDEELNRLAQIETGAPYDSLKVTEAVQRLRDDYFTKGHASARVAPRVMPVAPDVDLVFQISEGDAVTIGEVLITGLHRTRESLVRRKLELKSGEALDPRKLVAAERRLLELGVFSRVAVTATSDNPATIKVEVEEEGPYHVAYDLRFSRDDQGTSLVDTGIGNIAGRGIELGGRYRFGLDVREIRGSFHLPAVGRAGDLTASVFRRDEDFIRIRELGSPLPFASGPDTETQQGFQLQQTRHLRSAWDLLYGYKFKRLSGALTDFRQDISSVEVSLIRDRRDNPLNARKGNFWSLSFELGPTFLLSDFNFFRAFGQVFLNHPLNDSLTWSQGYRLGLANGLDTQRLAEVELFGRSTELFRAGGANSLRGLATDSVGPPGPIAGLSAGGEAALILNQELRYQHSSGIGSALFYDAGNVFAQIKDFDLRLRHSIGAGLRYDSPVGLLRLDIAFPLSRKAGDDSYQWFFSFGQAF